MEKIVSWVKTHKAAILTVVSALITFLTSISSLTSDVKAGAIVSILLVVLPIMYSFLKDGLTDQVLKMIVNAVSTIQEIIVNYGMFDVTTPEGKVLSSGSTSLLTEEEIRERITKGL